MTTATTPTMTAEEEARRIEAARKEVAAVARRHADGLPAGSEWAEGLFYLSVRLDPPFNRPPEEDA